MAPARFDRKSTRLHQLGKTPLEIARPPRPGADVKRHGLVWSMARAPSDDRRPAFVGGDLAELSPRERAHELWTFSPGTTELFHGDPANVHARLMQAMQRLEVGSMSTIAVPRRGRT